LHPKGCRGKPVTKESEEENMKTIVRATVILPDTYVRIQRLHDDGFFFKLEEEIKVGEAAAEFIELLLAKGGKLIETHRFIDDDDFQEKICARYEYIAH
jgi:hypothetical protein